ncbi:hypothetical protein KTQ74_29910, partial [Pseudomonas chlororaphis]|uniref:hypothetical protein n=1 Tax=Pseudomonas chlororaphis TaxID=587753 RepID=UPI001E4DB99F
SPLGDATITRSAGFIRVIQLLNGPFVFLAFGQFSLSLLTVLLTGGHTNDLRKFIMRIIF